MKSLSSQNYNHAYSFNVDDFDVNYQDLFVVVPSNRAEVLNEFLNAWVDPDLNARFVIVYDGDSVPLSLLANDYPSETVSYWCWKDIARELGDDQWIIPRMTDCVRSFGFLKAKSLGARYIVSMDDDVRPCAPLTPKDYWEMHLRPLVCGLAPTYSTTYDRSDKRPRGLPCMEDELRINTPIQVAINHGLWEGVLDRHGRDEVRLFSDNIDPNSPIPHASLPRMTTVVPRGFMYPMCGMNVCFDVLVLPIMYFTLQGKIIDNNKKGGGLTPLPYDRWGDIWCGTIGKVVLDAVGLAVTSGIPHVSHNKLSNISGNVRKEQFGFSLHPKMIQALLRQKFYDIEGPLTVGKVSDLYLDIAHYFRLMSREEERYGLTEMESFYLDKLGEAMIIWVRLVNGKD